MMGSTRRGAAATVVTIIFMGLALFAYSAHEHAYYKRLYAIDGKIKGAMRSGGEKGRVGGWWRSAGPWLKRARTSCSARAAL
jgi:hypothetical protein